MKPSAVEPRHATKWRAEDWARQVFQSQKRRNADNLLTILAVATKSVRVEGLFYDFHAVAHDTYRDYIYGHATAPYGSIEPHYVPRRSATSMP